MRPDPDALPPVEMLLPHTGRAVLLDAVLEHGERHTVCRADPARAKDFAQGDGAIPSWVGLEILAQGVAVHAGLQARARGEAPQLGLFLGSRRVTLHAPFLIPGRPTLVRVEHRLGHAGPVSFLCTLRDAETDALLVAGQLNLLALRDPAQLPGLVTG